MAHLASSGPRVLVTGAAGFVGQRLVAALRLKKPDWILLTPPGPKGLVGPDFLDISNPTAVNAWIRNHRPELIIHLAAIAAVTASVKDPRTAWAVNMNGTLNLVLAIEEMLPAAHLLYISSSEVYGTSFTAGHALDESALLQPVNPYAASKAAADILVRQAAQNGLSATVMRPFNHTGPGQAENFVVSSFACQIARIEAGLQPPTLSVGALDDERDFLDVADVVDAYVRALEQRETLRTGEVFNVASGIPVRIGEILDRLLAHSQVSIKITQGAVPLRRAPVPWVAGDAGHLRRTLGWVPTTSLNDTLKAVLDYWRAKWSLPRLK